MSRTLGVLIFAVAAATRAADLPPSVERVLDGHGIAADEISIVVQRADAPEPELSHLADVPRNPASVMKLVTTWSALEYLGPAYSWPTEVYFLGNFDGRRLDGSLGLKGYGDPFLVVEEFWKLLRALRRLGLETVAGDLLIDDSFFEVADDDPGAFDGQPYRTYNVLPNALLVNFKAVYFQFMPDPATGRVSITTDPILSNLEIDNHLSLVGGPCRGYQRGVSFNSADPRNDARIIFDGRFPRGCRVYGMSRTVLRHETYTLGLFDSLWREMGGHFSGSVRKGVIAEAAEPVLTWLSPPLSDVVRSINKNSNNVMTRQLLYTLAAEQFGPPGTEAHGVEVVTEFLSAHGLDDGSLLLENGAGLSRNGRISARLLVDILTAARQSVYAPEFIASLSLGGLDGTTRGRFDERSGNGRMHVKTGRLDHVSALAGYVYDRSGRSYVVAILVNAENAHLGPGQEIEKAVVEWIQTLH